jgi:hypothetical protein
MSKITPGWFEFIQPAVAPYLHSMIWKSGEDLPQGPARSRSRINLSSYITLFTYFVCFPAAFIAPTQFT